MGDIYDLIELARANGFASATEAITFARQSRAEIERLLAKIDELSTLLVRQGGQILTMKAEIERLRGIIYRNCVDDIAAALAGAVDGR